jgi:glucoamylase
MLIRMTPFLAAASIVCVNAFAQTDFDTWLKRQEAVSVEKMMANVSAPFTSLGSVIASPEKVNPPYFHHWLRDSAITADTMVTLYQAATGSTKQNYRTQLNLLAQFSRKLQLTPSRGGLGEPLFNVDGSAFNNDWCRPQNDGPAIRAMALARFANLLLDEGDESYVRSLFYDSKLPTDSVIKTDLEYVSHHWQDTNCDLWEEVAGDHLYTRMVQRRGLLEGAKLADRLGDPLAAKWYRDQAKALEPEILKHWDAGRGIFVPTLNRTGGVDYKNSGMDASVILAFLHGDAGDGFISYTDPRLLGTFQKITDKFKEIYPINQRPGVPGVAIGRYPEDRYAGTNFNGGNPWVLLTAGFARFAYLAAKDFRARGQLKQANDLAAQGDLFLQRIKYHTGQDGSLAEQIDRNTGAMTSARDLTWSYVEVLQAIWKR